MGGIGIHAIDASRRDDADVRHRLQMLVLLHMRLHVADLDRRGVRAQHMLLVDVESVVHGTRRMVGRDVQRGEVVEIVFDLRAFRHGITDGMKQGFDAFQRARDRMQSAHAGTAPRQRHVQRLRRQLGIQCTLLDGIALRIQRGFDLLFDLVDARTGCRALFGGKFAQAFQQAGQAAFLAEITRLGIFQLCRVFYRGEALQCVIENFL